MAEGGSVPSSGSVAEPEKLIRSPTFQVVPAGGVLIMAVGGWFVGGGADETATLSNVAVVVTVLLWLLTAKPTYTSVAMLMVSEPTSTQFTPSLDW
jgi:hypothetical protein